MENKKIGAELIMLLSGRKLYQAEIAFASDTNEYLNREMCNENT